MKKETHLFDLPEELYIEVDSKFRAKVFGLALERSGNCVNFAKTLKEDVKNVRRWKNGSRSAPLVVWKKITQLELTSEEEVEKNIYKIKKSCGYIKNPKLPILVDKNLARVLAATFCDGGISNDNCVHYTNNNKTQRELFNKAVINAFGDVPLVYQGKRRKNTTQLVYSGVLGIILHKTFQVPKNKKIFIDAPIPKAVLNASDEVVRIFIQQCYDDKGWVNKSIGLVGV